MINVSALNDAPVISGFDGSVTYSSNGIGVVVDTNAVVTDVDSTNFATGKLTIQLTSNAQSTDRLEIRNQGIAAGQIAVSGAIVKYGGVEVGTFTGGSGSSPLVVTLNTNATPLSTQALLRNITFRSTIQNPSTLTRTVRVTLTDGDGGISVIAGKSINVFL